MNRYKYIGKDTHHVKYGDIVDKSNSVKFIGRNDNLILDMVYICTKRGDKTVYSIVPVNDLEEVRNK